MFNPLPPVTRALLVSNGLCFVLFALVNPVELFPLMLWPLGDYLVRFESGAAISAGFLPWQLVTYGFMHGNVPHLFFNMLALFMFGAPIEQVLGQRRYISYYFVCLIGAGLVQLTVATLAVAYGDNPYPTVGASGAVFGLLLAYAILFPNRQVLLLFPPIPMRARTFAILYGLLELVLGVTRTQSGVAHFAHLGGMVFGYGMLQYWRGRWPFRR